MNQTTISAATIPAIDHVEAMTLAAAEYDRFSALVDRLSPDDWDAQTDCPEWNVRKMVLHVLGTAEGSASIRENVHQIRAGKRWGKANGRAMVDGISVVQIAERSEISNTELPRRTRTAFPRALKGRAKIPALLRTSVKMKIEVPGISETWRLGYLTDLILTRDLWMHRVDVSRATGREIEVNAEHDGRIVADIVAEWTRRHGRPFILELTGPAGGVFVHGEHGDAIALDAIEFCRIVSGRASGAGLLTQEVAF
jgi:uncharacterized protein (TIGR03083 family)